MRQLAERREKRQQGIQLLDSMIMMMMIVMMVNNELLNNTGHVTNGIDYYYYYYYYYYHYHYHRISHFSASAGKHSPILGYVINRKKLGGLICNLKSFLQLKMLQELQIFAFVCTYSDTG